MKIASYLMGGLFAISVLLQYNDPDPIQWMLVYGAATALCFIAPTRKLHIGYFIILILICIIWISLISSNMWGNITFAEMFESMKATKPLVEIGREVGGLLIVAFWTCILAWYNQKKVV